MKLEKMTRRSLAMLLVMMMVFSLAVPAFADTGIADGTAVSEEDHNHNNEATSETENGEAVIDENQNLGEADPSEEESGNAANTNDSEAVHEHTPIYADNGTATCTEVGIMPDKICAVCGEVLEEGGWEGVLGHDYVSKTTEPTCTERGFTTNTCTRCDDEYIDQWVDALGHVEIEVGGKAATCTEDGVEGTLMCDRCKEVFKEGGAVIESFGGHLYIDNVIDPTCTEAGYTEHRCMNPGCGSVFTDTETEALGHSWDDGIVTTPATCENTGVRTYACTRSDCDATKEEEIAATGHNYTETVIDPTCTEAGYTEAVCENCGDSHVVEGSETAALGHSWDNGVVTTPAGIGTEGTITYTCQRPGCDAVRTESIDPLPPRPSTGGGGGGGAAPAPVEIDEPDVPLAAALPFDDVKENSWFREAVQYVYDNDLMSGEEDTVFNPNGATTRGMIVKTLYNMEKEPAVSSAAVFSDVAAGKWYSDAVSWAAENEIVKGYDDGSFRPESSITRQELAAILYRYAEYKKYDVTGRTELAAYADADAVSSFAKEAVEWSVKADLISGIESDGATVLAPANGATRAQLATMLMRFNQSFAAPENETK